MKLNLFSFIRKHSDHLYLANLYYKAYLPRYCLGKRGLEDGSVENQKTYRKRGSNAIYP